VSRSSDPPFACVTCEVAITGSPVFYVGLPFCCAGCVADGPCRCSYDDEADPADGAAAGTEARPTATPDLVGARS
jgi:hypothetical protein